MIVRHKDTDVLEVTIQDTVYLGKANALFNFKQYLETKMAELEKALTSTLFVAGDNPFKKEGLIYEGNQRKLEPNI